VGGACAKTGEHPSISLTPSLFLENFRRANVNCGKLGRKFAEKKELYATFCLLLMQMMKEAMLHL